MEQLLLHLFGDYITQNDWMALNKKKPGLLGELACLTHCLVYSLPFLFITTWAAVLMIFISHYIIDRTNFIQWFLSKRNTCGTANFGYSANRPVLVSFWLYVITDNTFHLGINYLLIKYLS